MPTRESQEVRDTDQARDTLSRQLLLETRQPARFVLPARHNLMGLSHGDDVAITHQLGFESEGRGWGKRVFDRGHAEVEGLAYDPGNRRFLIGFRDVRQAGLRGVWLPGTTRLRQRGRATDGEGIVCHQPRWWWRPQLAYVDDPETGMVTQIYNHTPKLSRKGFLVERFRTNGVAQSSFNDETFWSSAGTGSAGSAVGADMEILLYAYPDSEDGSARSPDRSGFVLTGNPNTVDTYFFQTCIQALISGNIYCLNVDHWDRDGVPPSVAIQLGANWWTGAGWGAFTWLPLTASSASAWRRDSIIFSANANATPAIRVGFRSSDGNAKRTNLGHVQMDLGRAAGVLGASHPWPGSRIVTPSTAQERIHCEGDVLMFDNVLRFPGGRLWPAAAGTALFTGTSLWSSGANVSGFTFTVFRVRYDANNEIKLFYDGTNSRWTLRRKSGGTTTDLNHNAAVTAGTPVTIEVRWTSSYGELVDVYGAPTGGERWFDMIVNGTRVSGSDSVQPVESTESVFILGGEEAEQWDGYIKAQIFPYVLTENQCAKWRLAA